MSEDVTQADIECFKELFSMSDGFMDIEGDDAETFQILARHRLAAAKAMREALEDAKQSLEVAIYGLPDMLERNALIDEEGMVPALQAAVDRMNAALNEEAQAAFIVGLRARATRYELTGPASHYRYGPWHIAPADWIRPHPSVDWDWWHDNAEDQGPGGSAASLSACIADIHEWEDDHAPD